MKFVANRLLKLSFTGLHKSLSWVLSNAIITNSENNSRAINLLLRPSVFGSEQRITDVEAPRRPTNYLDRLVRLGGLASLFLHNDEEITFHIDDFGNHADDMTTLLRYIYDTERSCSTCGTRPPEDSYRNISEKIDGIYVHTLSKDYNPTSFNMSQLINALMSNRHITTLKLPDVLIQNESHRQQIDRLLDRNKGIRKLTPWYLTPLSSFSILGLFSGVQAFGALFKLRFDQSLSAWLALWLPYNVELPLKYSQIKPEVVTVEPETYSQGEAFDAGKAAAESWSGWFKSFAIYKTYTDPDSYIQGKLCHYEKEAADDRKKTMKKR